MTLNKEQVFGHAVAVSHNQTFCRCLSALINQIDKNRAMATSGSSTAPPSNTTTATSAGNPLATLQVMQTQFENKIDGRLEGLASKIRQKDSNFSWTNIDQRTTEERERLNRLAACEARMEELLNERTRGVQNKYRSILSEIANEIRKVDYPEDAHTNDPFAKFFINLKNQMLDAFSLLETLFVDTDVTQRITDVYQDAKTASPDSREYAVQAQGERQRTKDLAGALMSDLDEKRKRMIRSGEEVVKKMQDDILEHVRKELAENIQSMVTEEVEKKRGDWLSWFFGRRN
jgi:hypothetical protein